MTCETTAKCWACGQTVSAAWHGPVVIYRPHRDLNGRACEGDHFDTRTAVR